MEKKDRREFALSYLHTTYGFTLAVFAYVLLTYLFTDGYMVWVLYLYSLCIGIKLYKAYVRDFMDFPPIDNTIGILIDFLIPIMAYGSILNVKNTLAWLIFNTVLFFLAIGKCICTIRDAKGKREAEDLGSVKGHLLRNIIYTTWFFTLSIIEWKNLMAKHSGNILIIVSIPIIWFIGYLHKTKFNKMNKRLK